MGISFSSSLFGSPARSSSAFSICRWARHRTVFYTELEDWLSTTVRDLGSEGIIAPGTSVSGANAEIRGAMERLREVIAETGSSKAATNAMANLAEAIQGLVQNMRAEQQMIRNWADAQADQHGQIKRLLEMLMSERQGCAARHAPGRTRKRKSVSEAGLKYLGPKDRV